MIEECRVRLGLLYPKWLPIAITFNQMARASKEDFSWKIEDSIVAYAICCRIISLAYTIPIYEAQNLTKKGLKSVMDLYDDDMKRLSIDLIVGNVGMVKVVKPLCPFYHG